LKKVIVLDIRSNRFALHRHRRFGERRSGTGERRSLADGHATQVMLTAEFHLIPGERSKLNIS
jgi:hypothetical protein